MKTLMKKLLVVAAVTVVSVTTLTGCSSLEQINARGQALRDANPAAYEAMTGESNYFSQTPAHNVHGS